MHTCAASIRRGFVRVKEGEVAVAKRSCDARPTRDEIGEGIWAIQERRGKSLVSVLMVR
jgi:hypothetical protein